MAGSDNVLNTPGLMDPSTDFGNMMQHAMKIKGAQMEQDRKKFETWPQYFQNTLWMQGRAIELRELPVTERLEPAKELKDKGNAHFREKRFSEAVEQYEQALGSFRYAKQHDEGWKKKGIRDETIENIDERGEGETRAAIDEFLVSCYNNLAACYLGRAASGEPEPGSTVDADYRLCIAACTAALELQPECAKAFYRRARALTEPLSAGAEAMDEAIRDLTEAAKHSPDDKAVRALLNKLRKERAAQRSKDNSTYSGMFCRGEIYDEKSLEEQAARQKKEAKQRERAEKRRTVADCEREAKEADAVVQSLQERGKTEDARQLAAKIQQHRTQLEDYKTAQKEHETNRRVEPKDIDFRNPTAEQIADAKKHGIDLMDPLVVEELERLQLEKDAEDEADDLDPAMGARERTVRHRRRRPPPPDVGKIPLHEIRRRLDDMGVDYSSCVERPQLEQMLLAQCRRRDDEPDEFEYDASDIDDDEGRGQPGWLRSTLGYYCTIS